jgi:mitogen-activated protein kinase kinase kinase
MTVDEITAEVESRRESRIKTTGNQGSDTEEWTKVDNDEIPDDDPEDTYNEDGEEDTGPSDEEEITLNDPEVEGEGDDEVAKVTMKKGRILRFLLCHLH